MRGLIALILPVALAGAQARTAPDTTPLPRELGAAMVGLGTSTRAANIVVGKAPTGFPSELIPRGELLGSTRDRVFVRSADEVPSALAALRDQLGAAGFKPAVERPEGDRVGFLEAPSATRQATFGTLCRDTLTVSYSSMRRTGGGAYLSVTLQPVTEYSNCHPRNSQRIMDEMQQAPPPLPRLFPPAGLSRRSGGYGGGSDGYHASSVYDGPTVYTDSVMFVFTAQLKEQGWSGIQLLGGGEYAALVATKPGERGRTIRLMIVDMRADSRLHFITMQTVIAR